ncbi:MAG: FimB/Mfa2 family fimbrial subunit [Dysgonomonas sp.]
MKKVFISLMTAALLFSACGSDEKLDEGQGGLGSLKVEVDFEEAGSGVKADPAMSKAIPITSWANVKQVQMFLYEKATGKVVFTYEIKPTTTQATFNWTNIPVGNYDLALVANVKSSTDNITTYVNGLTAEEFTNFNSKDRILNTDVFMELKKRSTLPATHTWEAGDIGYDEPSEIFTAYAEDVQIQEGVPASIGPLKLLREVALMRVRINKNADFLNESGKEVNFADASNLIVIHRMPESFGLKTPHTMPINYGGVSSASNDNMIMVAATGAQTFKTADPSSADYTNPTIIDANFKLWRDIIVLPNVSKSATAVDPAGNAADARKYFVVISALAPAGYKLDNGKVLTAPTKLYWSGLINEVFTQNVIREVNLTIKSRGDEENPEGPTHQGSLDITVSIPENWNQTIQRTDQDI